MEVKNISTPVKHVDEPFWIKVKTGRHEMQMIRYCVHCTQWKNCHAFTAHETKYGCENFIWNERTGV